MQVFIHPTIFMVKIIGLCLLLERCSKSSTFKFITIGSATFKKGIP